MHFASSAGEALDVLRSQPVDVIITDMRMPEMDGAGFIKESRKLRPSTLRIGLSGYSELERLASSGLDFHQFWTKPCELERLTTRLDLYFSRFEATPQEYRDKLLALNGIPVYAENLNRFRREIARNAPDFQEIRRLISEDAGVYTLLGKLFSTDFFGYPRNIESSGDISAALEFLKIVSSNSSFPVSDQREASLREFGDNRLERLATAGNTLVKADPDSVGLCPSLVGAFLAAAWGYPAEVVEALAERCRAHSHQSTRLEAS